MKKTTAVLLSAILCMCMGCAKPQETVKQKEANLIPDPLYEQGFVLTGFDSRPEYNERDIGRIDYGKTGLDPVWRLGQWGCKKNIVNAEHSFEDGFDVYRDGSKTLKLNRTSGAFTLNVDASKDGVYDDGPRKNNEPWIHFIMEIPDFRSYTMLKDLEYLTFYSEFRLTVSENLNGAAYDPGLHSAMFLWYITVADMTDRSQYMWFGLPIYDNRHEYSPEFAQQDGGKEDATDAFIFNPGAATFLDAPVRVGEYNVLSRDMLPTVKHAFEVAQARGFMKNSKFENLGITLMYIGWELPGTFNVGMDVSDMRLLAGYKATK